MATKKTIREEKALGLSKEQAQKLDFDFEFLKSEENGLHKGTLKFLKTSTFPPEGSRINLDTFIEWSNFVHTLDTIYRVTKTHNPPKLAELLDIKPPSVYHAFAKGHIPQNWIRKIDRQFKVSIDEMVMAIVEEKLSSMEKTPATKKDKSKINTEAEGEFEGYFDKMLRVIGEEEEELHNELVGKILRAYNKCK